MVANTPLLIRLQIGKVVNLMLHPLCMVEIALGRSSLHALNTLRGQYITYLMWDLHQQLFMQQLQFEPSPLILPKRTVTPRKWHCRVAAIATTQLANCSIAVWMLIIAFQDGSLGGNRVERWPCASQMMMGINECIHSSTMGKGPCPCPCMSHALLYFLLHEWIRTDFRTAASYIL